MKNTIFLLLFAVLAISTNAQSFKYRAYTITFHDNVNNTTQKKESDALITLDLNDGVLTVFGGKKLKIYVTDYDVINNPEPNESSFRLKGIEGEREVKIDCAFKNEGNKVVGIIMINYVTTKSWLAFRVYKLD